MVAAPEYFEDEDAPSLPAEQPHTVRGIALLVWGICATVLLAPPFFVWIVRGVAFAAQCAPGPGACHGMTLGGGLRDAFELSWMLSDNINVVIAITLLATLAGLVAKRPLLAASGLLLLPLATLILPMMAMHLSQYGRCKVEMDIFQNCTLWGAQMGDSFHNAAGVPDIVMGFAPYSFALAIMIGVLGWFLTRPRSPRNDTRDPFSDRGH